MRRKKQLALICALLALILILGSMALIWGVRYRSVGLSPLAEWNENYTYNGKLMLSENGEKALLYHPLGREGFEELTLQSIDLTPYGFEGEEFSYYRVETEEDYGAVYVNYYSPDPAYEPFWPVCMRERFVYLDEDGKKYRIQPEESLCFPVFADSIDGVDPYAQDVIAFSANATYAIALDGTDVKVYQTDPMDASLRIVSVNTYSLAEYGKEARFGAFVGNTQAYFILSGEQGEVYVALNCATGETAKSLLDPEGEYKNVLNRLYAQRLDPNEDEEEFRLKWSHLLLGTEFESDELEGFREGELLAVSPAGDYAVAKVSGASGEDVLALNKKRSVSLSTVITEGNVLKDVFFVYENVIVVNLESADGTLSAAAYKICF